MKKVTSLIVLGFAAACSSADKVYVPLNGAGTTALATTVAGASATLDRDTNTLTYNGETGQINAAGDTVTFASGATMALSGTDSEYARLFVLSGANPTIGAYGVNTARRDIPNGMASFEGDSILVVTSTDGIFDLTGDVTANVDFNADDASVTLDNLSGTLATGLSAPSAVSDFGTVEISGIEMTDGALTGGSTQVTTDQTNAFDGAIDGGVSASMFGPNAEEVAGSVNATGDDGALTGGFIANR